MEEQAEKLKTSKESVVIAHNLIEASDPQNINPTDDEVKAVIESAMARAQEAKERLAENKRNLKRDFSSTLVSIAPFRNFVAPKLGTSLEDAVAIRNEQIALKKLSDTYKDAAYAVASALGLQIENFSDTRGSFERTVEPSFAITFDKETADGKADEILLFTALMSDLGYEQQKTAYVTRYLSSANDPDANAVEFSLRTNLESKSGNVPISALSDRLRTLMNEEGLEGEGFAIDPSRNEIRFIVADAEESQDSFQEKLGKYRNLIKRLQTEILNKDGKVEYDSTPASSADLNSDVRRGIYADWLDQDGKNHQKLSGNARELIVQAQRRAERLSAQELAERTKENYAQRANPQDTLTQEELEALQSEVVAEMTSAAETFEGRYLYRVDFKKDGRGKEAMFVYTEENLTASEQTSTALARLHGTYTPERLKMRVDMLARSMSSTFEMLAVQKEKAIQSKIEELKALRSKVTKDEKPVLNRKIAKLSRDYSDLVNRNSGRPSAKAAAINVIGIDKIVARLLSDLSERKWTQTDYIASEYQKVLDNFAAMQTAVVHRFAYLEGVELRRSADSNIEDDDELGAYATGNDGWGEEAHASDTFKGLSETVRSALKNCVLRENTPTIKKGKKVYAAIKDDLGQKMYIDPKTAYQEIASVLSKMVDDSDFHDAATDSYPALERMAEREGFAWVRDVVNYLKRNPDSASLFYNAFRMDLTQYWHCDELGRFKPVNSLPSGDSFYNDAKRAVQYSEKYADISLWDKGALSDFETIKTLSSRLSEANKILSNKKFMSSPEMQEEFAMSIANLVRAIGVNVSDDSILELVSARVEAKEKQRLHNITAELGGIIGAAYRVKNPKKSSGEVNTALADNMFSRTYNNFRRLGGELDYFNGTSYQASFRDAGATFYALEKPNFVTTTVKVLKLDDTQRRHEYINRVYRSNYFMYDSVNGWKNVILGELWNPDNTKERSLLDICTFNSYGGKKFPAMTASEIRESEVGMFFAPAELGDSDSTAAWYHVPNYSNAQSSDFIKYKRERGRNYKEVLADKIMVGVKQELNRIRLGQIRQEKLAKNTADGGTANIEEIARWDKNSTKFCMFPFFESWVDDETGLNLLAASDKYYQDKDEKAFNAFITRGIYEMLRQNVLNYDFPVQQFKQAYRREFGSDLDPKEAKEFSKKISDIKVQTIQACLEAQDRSGFDKDVVGIVNLIENYVWNSHFMLHQITELLTSDLAFYKRGDQGVDLVKRFKEVTASGDALYTQSKYGKRYSVVIGIRDHDQTSLDYNYIKKSLQDAVADGRLSGQRGKEMAEFILSHYEHMNITDGQSFRTLPSLRSVMDMVGKWTPDLQDAYVRIMQGKYDEADLYAVFVAIKPFIFDMVSTETGVVGREMGLDNDDPITIGVPTQYKDSEAVLMTLAGKLSGAFEHSAKARGLERFMVDYGIDIAKFESTTKVGLQGAIDLRYSPSFLEKDKERREKIEKGYAAKYGNSAASWTDYMDFAREEYINSLKQGKISQETFNSIMAEMEPTEEEVYDLLSEATVPLSDTDALPDGIQWKQNPNPYQDWETDGMSDTQATLYRQNRKMSLNPQRVKFIDNRDYRIVQPTREHLFDTKVVLGVQSKNLITADLPENFSMTIRGRHFNAEETRKFFHSLLVENLLEDYKKLAGVFDSPEKLSEALQSAIVGNPKYDDDILQALELETVTDPITGVTSTKFRTPMGDPANSHRLAEIILSLFKNRIAKQTIFGGAAVIETGWSFSKDLHSVRDENGNLKGYECYLPAWSKLYFGKYLNPDGSFDHERMAKEHPELMRMVGYRIPTDHKHSMVPLIVKGFLPQEKGNQIIMAEEAIVAAGEDKDIDKKYLIMPAFTIPMDREKFRSDFLNFRKANGAKLSSGTELAEVDDAIEALVDGSIQTEKDGIAQAVFDFYTENAEKYGTPDIQMIEYDVNKSPEEQTRTQRNNMLFEMMYNILINPSVSEQTQMPTNFVSFKKGGFLANVAKNMALNPSKAVAPRELLSRDFKTLENDSNNADAAAPYDPFSPMNFARHHQANMDALKLVGIFAANLTVNAKYQGTDSRLTEKHHFKIGGKMVTSLVERKDIDDMLSSFNYSESINASTDNGKDPSVARLGITRANAGLAATMIATGASINMISFFLNHPSRVRADGSPADPLLRNDVGKILSENYARPSNKSMLQEDGITEEELLQCILEGEQLWDLIEQYRASQSQDAVDSMLSPVNFKLTDDQIKMLQRNLKAMVFLKNYEDISDVVFSGRTAISRADSTNGAVDHTLAGTLVQQRSVDVFHRRIQTRAVKTFNGELEFDPVIELETLDTTYPKNMKSILEGELTDSKLAELRKAFNESGLPVAQAAHTLGIEAAQVFMGRYFSNYTDRVKDIYNEIMDNSAYPKGREKEQETDDARKILNGLTTYALAGTDLFGDDGTHTMQQKREYYVYSYPHEFFKIIKENPELKELYYFGNIKVYNGKLRLDGASRLTRDQRLQIKADLDNVFLGRILPEGLSEQEKQNKLATYNRLVKDLLCYSFYTGQLTFGAANIGMFLSDDIKHAFPEYIEALEHIDRSVQSDTQKEHFMDELFAQGQIPMQTIDEKVEGVTIAEDGSMTIPSFSATNDFLDGKPVKYLARLVQWEEKDDDGNTFTKSRLDRYKLVNVTNSGRTAHYAPMKELQTIDGTKYNPNSTFEEDNNLPDNTGRWNKLVETFTRHSSIEDMLLNSISAQIDAVGDDRFDEMIESLDAAINNRTKSSGERIVKYSGDWKRSDVAADAQSLYIFTDNTDRDSGKNAIPEDSWYSKRYGVGHHFPTMTAAVIRGLNNARPVSTQRWYHEGAKGTTGRWNNEDFEAFKEVIDAEFADIKAAWDTGKFTRIVLPSGDGLFNGKISAITKERTPDLYDYLQAKVTELTTYVNSTSSTESSAVDFSALDAMEDAFEGQDLSGFDEVLEGLEASGGFGEDLESAIATAEGDNGSAGFEDIDIEGIEEITPYEPSTDKTGKPCKKL